MRERGSGWIAIFLLFLIVGLYLINITLTFIKIPEAIAKIDKWIILAGGVLCVLGGIIYMRLSSEKKYKYGYPGRY